MFIPSAKSNWITYACMHDASGAVSGTYYVTVSLEVAVKLYRELHPGTKASDFAALDAFMTERNARWCDPPDHLRVNVANAALKASKACATMGDAAKKLGMDEKGYARLIAGNNDRPPGVTLKRLGLFRSVRYFPENVK